MIMAFDPFTGGFELIKTGLDKFFPDADTELKGRLDAAARDIDNTYQLQLQQIIVNNEEAKHPSIFVAGARPAAMWIGVLTLAYSGILVSLLSWISLCFNLPPLPVVDTIAQENILYGLLGLGAFRTAEKIKQVDTKRTK